MADDIFNATCSETLAAMPNCSRVLVYDSSTFCCPGFGAQISNVLVAYMVALAAGRQFVWDSTHYSWGCPASNNAAALESAAAPGGANVDSKDCLFLPSPCRASLRPTYGERLRRGARAAFVAGMRDCRSDEGGACSDEVAREATLDDRLRLFEYQEPIVLASQFTAGTAFFFALWDRAGHYAGADVCTEASFRARPPLRRLCADLGSPSPSRWLDLFRIAAPRVLRLRPGVLEEVERAASGMNVSSGLGSELDAAFHMRFGDKVGTNDYVPTPLTEYVARFEAIAAASSATAGGSSPSYPGAVFVATDDTGAVRAQMKQLEGDAARVNFRFASVVDGVTERDVQGGASQNGHSEQRFNALPPAERFKQHVQLLAELRTLARAPIFVCNYKSKLALLAEVLRGPNMTTVTVGAHGPVWMPGG